VYGDKQFQGVGYPTPISIPEDTSCLILQIPADDAWWGVVIGLLYSLILEWNWQQFEGGLDRDVVAARWQQMLEDALDTAASSNSCITSVPTPYWDEDTDVDDEAVLDDQIWYGYVSDLDNPTTTFVEDVAIWGFAGFLALAGAPAAAVAFTTVAPRFVVAIRRGNLAEIVRLYVDSEQVAEIDTSAYVEGDVIRTAVLADPALSTHDLMLVKAE
jgi:hypothetical protein